MLDLFFPWVYTLITTQIDIFRRYRQIKTALSRAIVNSRPSSCVCTGCFNLIIGLLIHFLSMNGAAHLTFKLAGYNIRI